MIELTGTQLALIILSTGAIATLLGFLAFAMLTSAKLADAVHPDTGYFGEASDAIVNADSRYFGATDPDSTSKPHPTPPEDPELMAMLRSLQNRLHGTGLDVGRADNMLQRILDHLGEQS